MVKVSVKWGKQKFDNLELNLDEPPSVFKSQLYSLTNVLPERQKIMVKGGTLKDDADWKTLGIKDGHTFMLMGSAEEVKAPTEKVVFMEDLSEDQATAMVQAAFPAGLTNLGNTCYMNSTLQCMKAVPELVDVLKKYRGNLQEGDTSNNLTVAMRDLFGLLTHSNQPIPPLVFLQVLRAAFPQFAQKGQNGAYMQQDAEECWTQIMLSLGQKLPRINAPADEKPAPTNSAVFQLFGGEMLSTLANQENAEEEKVVKKDHFFKLSCHISNATNYLLDGLKEGLTENIAKRSETLGREANYTRTSKICRLPYYLTVQFVRFFWKQDKQVKAKIVKPIEFPLVLDLYDLCSDDLKPQLEPNRKKLQEIEDQKVEAKKQKKEENPKDEAEPMVIQQPTPVGPEGYTNNTGLYELFAVLTHKGRMADSGHYVAWVKEAEDKWAKYDDDVVSYCNTEEIKKLSGKGGGDWHMAYMIVYRSKNAPQ